MAQHPAGHDHEFLRVLTRRDVLALAFGAMIGWGWVVLVGNWIERGGSLGAVLGFFIAGTCLSIIALIYAELAAAMPHAGGEHVYSLRALGPPGAFVCTWALIFAYASVAAFEAVALPTVFEYLVPGLKQGFLWNVAGYDVYLTWVLVGVLGSVVITAINYYGIRFAGTFQTVAAVIILVGGIGLLAAAGSKGDAANLQPLFAHGISGVAAVTVIAPFLLFGFDVIPQASEEIDLPPRTLGVLIFGSVIVATLWYCMLIFLISYVMNEPALKASSLPAADAGAQIGAFGKYAVLTGGIAGLLTSWNGFLVGGSRAIFALAESGMLPRFLGRLHPTYRTPANAVLLIGVLACFAPLFGRTMLVWIADAGAFGIVLAYLMVAISFVVLRNREPEMPRPFRVPAGKIVGVVAVLLSLVLCLFYLPGSPAALKPPELVIVLLWSAAGVFFYRSGGRREK